MKELSWLEWLLIIEVWLVMLWMVAKTSEWVFTMVMTKIFKRDFEQEAIDRVFKNRNIQSGQKIIITYKNGVVVTMEKD